MRLKPGQGAKAQADSAPKNQINIKPEDAVNWALYYPSILPFPENTSSVDADIRTALNNFRQGRVDDALFKLDSIAEGKRSPYFYKVRGAIRLTSGRVELALQDVQSLLANNPNDAEALSLQSVLALTQNRKTEALSLANKAIEADIHSASAYSALSYAEQGRFELDKALAAAEQAVKYAPHDAMLWARKAELELAKGFNSESEHTTQQALDLDPNLERTQTVRGFSALTRMETDEALQAFEQAVTLDSTSPLARLGLGLAKIRKGKLPAGRKDLEIAVILDPNNALLRSYLGKAYFEENRNELSEDQLNLAKTRDPKDPTPYFYDAIKKQTENRPVEALQELQQAMALNDNRAVYRSKQLLDSDRAARGASLARIYDNLGFEQRGIVEATTSLQLDPTNFSAHRFLSDSYVNQSSRETAQLSELLQAKLLQPININPVQPHLAVSQRGLLNSSGMASSSFQDFTRNFEGNRPQMIVSGVVGNMGTYSDEVTLSGLLDKFSYSLGQYHYQTDGFTRADPNLLEKERHNTDQRHDIYDAFLQGAVNDRLNVQFEYVHRETQQGDYLQHLIQPPPKRNYLIRNNLRESIYRAGINLRLFTNDHLLASYIHKDSFSHSEPPVTKKFDTLDSVDFFESQHIHQNNFFNLTTGFSFYSMKENGFVRPNNGLNGRSVYSYINVKIPEARIIGTLGFSFDYYDKEDDPSYKVTQNYPIKANNPKFGLMWDFNHDTKFRLAYFTGNKRPSQISQSIEPTQIAGFDQFFDDYTISSFSFYGGAIDIKIQPNVFSGVEFSQRTIFNADNMRTLSKKDSVKLYFNCSLSNQFSITADYSYTKDKYETLTSNDPSYIAPFFTHKVPLELRYFDYSGFFGKLTGIYVNQVQEKTPNSSSFFLLDAAIGFRLPKRLGIVSIEGKNLLNNQYRFEDMSRYSNNIFFNGSEFIPQRGIFMSVILSI